MSAHSGGFKGGERGTSFGPPFFSAPPFYEILRGASRVNLLIFGEKLIIHSYNIQYPKADHKWVLCFQKDPNSKCNVQAFFFQNGPKSNCNV